MIYRIDGMRLDLSARALLDSNGALIRISARAFEALRLLIELRERAVGRDELVERIWGRSNVSDAQLAQIILAARRALGDHGDVQAFIRTVPGFGYQWVGRIEAVSVVAAAAEVPAVMATDTSAPAPVATVQAPPSPAVQRRKLPARLSALLLLLVLGLGLLAWWWSASSRFPAADSSTTAERIVVLPLTVDPAAGVEASWLRLGGMDLIAGRLRASGFIVPPTENVLQLLRAQAETPADVDRESIKLAARAALLVQGSVRQQSGVWILSLKSRRSNGLLVRVEGSDADPIRAVADACDRLLAALGRKAAMGIEDEDGDSLLLRRARIAVLENDLDLARTILSAAPEPQRSSAEVQARLIQIDSRAGRLVEVIAALDRLLLQTELTPSLRARLLIMRGSAHLRDNSADLGQSDFTTAAQLIDDGLHPGTLGKALTGSAIVHRRRGELGLALAAYGRARMALERAGDDVSLGRLISGLAAIETQRYNWLAAMELFTDLAQRFETYGAVNEMATALTNLAECQRQLLRWNEAEHSTARAMALLPRVVDPGVQAQIMLGRSQVLLGAGQLDQAAALLQDIAALALPAGRIEARHAAVLQAELLWERGEPSASMDAAHAVWLTLTEAGTDGLRSRALLLWVQAKLASGGQDSGSPSPLSGALDPPPALDDVDFKIASALQALADADEVRARQLLDSALEWADRHNSPWELAQVTVVYGKLLIKAQQFDQAAAMIGRLTPYAEQDFQSASIVAELHLRRGDLESHQRTIELLRRLAGQRPMAAP